jgi:hypothetical protein
MYVGEAICMPQDLDHGRSTKTVPSNGNFVNVKPVLPQVPPDAFKASRGAADKAWATQVLASYFVAMASPDELENTAGFF